MPAFDIAVVGLGAVGSAALLAGARAGAKIIGLDRYAPPHPLGSTHGETRIVRAAIGEGAEYTPFALRSFALWDELERETGKRLVTRCGLLILGEALPHAAHVGEGFFEATLASAKRHAIRHEVLMGQEVRDRFPAFASFDGARAYFEPGAGMADPERVVAAQLGRAKALGAETRIDTPVLSIGKDGKGAIIRTQTESVRATKVILAAGAWTPGFLPQSHASRLTVTRQVMHWFGAPDPPRDFEPAHMPAFIWNDLYGFPIASPGGAVKVATEALTAITAPDSVREVCAADIDQVLPRVRSAFPQLGPHLKAQTCLYTSTPTSNFWVAAHPELESVTVVSACSGHGFKHAAAIGEAVIGASGGLAIPRTWQVLARPLLNP